LIDSGDLYYDFTTNPGSVHGEAGIRILAALFKTYMQKGGMQLQINVVDTGGDSAAFL
jgi:pyruvate-formate lyase